MFRKSVDVAIFIPSLSEGGIERVYLNLAHELVRLGVGVDLLVAQARGSRKTNVPKGARVIDLSSRRRGTLWLLRGFRRYLRSTHPEAILASSGLNLAATWAKLLGLARSKVIVSVHNTLSAQFASLGYLHSALMPPLLGTFYPRADAVVAVSTSVADDLCALLQLPRERVEVIYNPVVTRDLLVWMERPVTDCWFREAPLVLGVGSLIPRKDYATLVRAFALVRRQRQVRLAILGEGEDRGGLERLVGELGLVDDVALPGFVNNPYPYFRQARVFGLSSRWEGLPTNVVEALACGCPVVATACPGAQEILENGRLGRLVPIGDVEAMAQAMRETLDDPPDPGPLRQRAMDFHVDRIVERYREVLGV